jgi:hypothetical protein
MGSVHVEIVGLEDVLTVSSIDGVKINLLCGVFVHLDGKFEVSCVGGNESVNIRGFFRGDFSDVGSVRVTRCRNFSVEQGSKRSF